MLIRLQEKYNKRPATHFEFGRARWGGGDETPAPQAPSIGQSTTESSEASMQAWLKNYPAIFAMQQQMAPQEAAQQVALAQQYAQPLAQAFKSVQETMYPQETAMTKALNEQAMTGMTQSTPEWYNQNVRDTLKSQFGRNLVYNPQAQEDYGIKTAQASEDWKRYYQNMGLSITGRQPIATAQQPQYTNQMSGYTPQSVGQLGANAYGIAGGIYGNQLSNYTSMQQYNPWANIGGAIGGAALGGMTGGMFGGGGIFGRR
jgi:hypothetical protein